MKLGQRSSASTGYHLYSNNSKFIIQTSDLLTLLLAECVSVWRDSLAAQYGLNLKWDRSWFTKLKRVKILNGSEFN